VTSVRVIFFKFPIGNLVPQECADRDIIYAARVVSSHLGRDLAPAHQFSQPAVISTTNSSASAIETWISEADNSVSLKREVLLNRAGKWMGGS